MDCQYRSTKLTIIARFSANLENVYWKIKHPYREDENTKYDYLAYSLHK